MRTWKEQLKVQLIKAYGEKKGIKLSDKYTHDFSCGFPHGYGDEYSVDVAINDIEHLEQLSDTNNLSIDFYKDQENEQAFHLRLFQWHTPIPLSDVLPMLENLDLRTYNERPYKIILDKKIPEKVVYISDFTVTYSKRPLKIEQVKSLFQTAFERIYQGVSENDGFNKLVLGASLSWNEIVILRAYAKYLRQVGFRFSQPYIEDTLAQNPTITKDLIHLFITLHNPHKRTNVMARADEVEKRILANLELVTSLEQDFIIRRLLNLIRSTLRTNYFQKINGVEKSYLSLKFKSRDIPDQPLPVPLYEIFVYSPRFEGIHLRNTKIARGGIRWSDRREDFRTEILGLMKAQVVKNSVIVPSGAKGGFVLKHNAPEVHPSHLKAEVISCYQSFIRGLLDLTDNIKNKKCKPPVDTVCYDDDDPYLVVAADKGTASFSDIANAISEEYDFWLSDAFASGGKTGYDHKKLGITARGAWESIKRHLLEIDLDINKHAISVVGIGDMSGDVFGNGMIYSPQIRLLAAFDHRDIFFDPNPDLAKSYNERLRMFQLPTSSWQDYNPKLISKGGGVFKRSSKSITLTTQMKMILAVEDDTLTPNDFIAAILRAPVDLLYNGGIGTYVKSSTESNADVSDRANDYCRVNGNELRCKIVGEGGNLGFTQLGRIEYALKGGIINTDFIDNSAGVDCSDHEVNLKILFAEEVKRGNLTLTQRNKLLVNMKQEVADLVLADNYNQALVMSFSAHRAKQNIGLHSAYIKELESHDAISRAVAFLPDDKKLVERKAAGDGLTRPELATLLAYTKINLKNEILKTDLTKDPYLSNLVVTAFPASIRKKYRAAMEEHRLRDDIIATQLSNKIINEMGITFVYRLQVETGATIEEIVRAHTISSTIFKTDELQSLVKTFDFKISYDDQYDMLFHIRNLISLASRWFLHSRHLKGKIQDVIANFSERIKKLENLIPELMAGSTRKYLETLTEQFLDAGLPENIARRIATDRAIYTSLNIIEVATSHKFDLIKTAKVYFAAGEGINLLWFRDQLAHDKREGHWNTLARLTLRDELDIAQRALTIAIINSNKHLNDADKLIEGWVNANQRAFARWERLLSMLHSSSSIDYTMFFIAIRELLGLINTSED